MQIDTGSDRRTQCDGDSVSPVPNSVVSVASLLGEAGFPSTIRADHVALRWNDRSLSYRELKSRSRALAQALIRRGLAPGDRVVVHLLNRGETFELYFACAYAGLTIVPTNFRFRAGELASVFVDVEPALVITQRCLADVVNSARAEYAAPLDTLILADEQSGDEYEELASREEISAITVPAGPHLILFSSGTTGRPKGITMSHACILNFAAQWSLAFPLMDRNMCTLVTPPTFNAAGINDLVIATFANGGTVAVMPSRGWSPAKLAEYTARYRATHAIWFPTLLNPIMSAPHEVLTGFSSMRSVVIGGEHCTPTVQHELRRVFPKVLFTNTFGLTEGGLVSLLNHDEFEMKPDSVGRVSPGGQLLEIRSPSGEPVPIGDVGEIWSASNFMPEGYWGSTDQARSIHQGGWLHTGDLGRLDADGYLYIEGRSRDLIISKGQNIFPAEIETVLMQYTGVTACAVVGLPDAEFGETPHAVVVPNDGAVLDPGEIIAFLRDRLAAYKLPQTVTIRDSLPISDANKVLKREVVTLLKAQLTK